MATVGDVAWEVEWCSEIPKTEFGDDDIDGAVRHKRYFRTRDAAMKYAAYVFPEDKVGSVMVTKMEFKAYNEDDSLRYPTVGFWEEIADAEHYEGPEA